MMFTVIKHTNQMTYKGPATHIFVPPGIKFKALVFI